MNPDLIRKIIEGALLAAGKPLDITKLENLFEDEERPPRDQIKAALEEIEAEACARWDLSASLIIHRVGRLAPGENIMMVAAASRHRKAAFEAAEFLMDYLKSRAPFWKKEITAASAGWVEAKAEDEAALKRW